jgi:hypothetical protein
MLFWPAQEARCVERADGSRVGWVRLACGIVSSLSGWYLADQHSRARHGGLGRRRRRWRRAPSELREIFEKGSVESTHKVPTSHYHTKHRRSLQTKRSAGESARAKSGEALTRVVCARSLAHRERHFACVPGISSEWPPGMASVASIESSLASMHVGSPPPPSPYATSTAIDVQAMLLADESIVEGILLCIGGRIPKFESKNLNATTLAAVTTQSSRRSLVPN